MPIRRGDSEKLKDMKGIKQRKSKKSKNREMTAGITSAVMMVR